MIRMLRKWIFFISLLSFVSCVSFSTREAPSYPSENGTAFGNYWKNRVMDFRDIFSFQIIWGLNAGAKVQVSRMGAGLYAEIGSSHPIDFSGEVGLRSGEVGSHSGDDFTFLILSTDHYQPKDTEKSRRAEARNKVESSGPDNKSPASWTRLGVAGGIFVLGIRAEFNPGELLDFVLGLFAIDIYKDDVYQKSK